MTKVLVIDDDLISRKVMVCALKRSGFDVSEASNGMEGVDVIRAEMHDVVVTDIFMPEQDGLRTIIDLKRDYPNLKIIAVSGGGKMIPADYLPVAETLGADLSLSKPIHPPDLVGAVHRLLGHS